MGDSIRLNIGSGDLAIPGFVSIDKKFGHDAAKLDYPDGSVDEVYASHVLEHFARKDVPEVLREWVRVLKPGGKIRIAVSSYELVTKMHQAGAFGWELANAFICGGQSNEYDVHKCQFTRMSLTELMRQSGLCDMKAWEAEYDDCAKYPISLRLEGTKWAFRKCDPRKWAGVVPCPRLGFKAQERCLRDLAHNRPPMMIDEMGGAFWDKSIEIQTMNVLANCPDADYLVFFDFDSVYTPYDFDRLMQHMEESPDLGAIFPVQQSRHEDKPLVFRTDQFDYSKPLTRVQFGHFGFTIIRRQVFEIIAEQHPWFFTIPDQHGRWDSWKSSDGDISFWRRLKMNGIPVAQANDVVIGHMELAVRWPEKGGTRYQPVSDYMENGKPDDVRFVSEDWAQKDV